jgi:hypothetical protein
MVATRFSSRQAPRTELLSFVSASTHVAIPHSSLSNLLSTCALSAVLSRNNAPHARLLCLQGTEEEVRCSEARLQGLHEEPPHLRLAHRSSHSSPGRKRHCKSTLMVTECGCLDALLADREYCAAFLCSVYVLRHLRVARSHLLCEQS